MTAPPVKVWKCDECGGIYWPQVVKAAGKCPGCGHPTGELIDRTEDDE